MSRLRSGRAALSERAVEPPGGKSYDRMRKMYRMETRTAFPKSGITSPILPILTSCPVSRLRLFRLRGPSNMNCYKRG